ncbi:MAG: radical SAM protein [Planctomycetota bacterium]|jgi:radical SAM superfamily enzyme YgiQ (UPF0313 family)
MRYVEPVFRPPSEASSYLLPVTVGCSHNRCTFCAMYLTKSFRVRPETEVVEDIEMARQHFGDLRRVFLLDGDAFVLSAGKLHRILASLREAFPSLQRVGVYANAGNVAAKTDEELRSLAAAGLTIGYLGLESGHPEVVEEMDKGATVDEMVEAVVRAQAAGIKMSVMALLGIAGRERSREHARATAEALNRMQPRYAAFLTVTPVPGTALHDDQTSGEFELPGPHETLLELKQIVAGLELDGTVFRANHASNYLPTKGRLPADKERILEAIEAGLAGQIRLKPEHLRGL